MQGIPAVAQAIRAVAAEDPAHHTGHVLRKGVGPSPSPPQPAGSVAAVPIAATSRVGSAVQGLVQVGVTRLKVGAALPSA